MAKYEPLASYLERRRSDEIALGFAALMEMTVERGHSTARKNSVKRGRR